MRAGWLTSAYLAEDKFLGSVVGLPMPYLLRHGIGVAKPSSSGGSIWATAEHVAAGDYRFFLPDSQAQGEQLDWRSSFFMPMIPLNLLIIGPELADFLRDHAHLDNSELISIPKNSVSSFHWEYELPQDPHDMSLYEKLYQDLSLEEELPPEDELLKLLSSRFPGSVGEIKMFALVPPFLRPASHIRKRKKGNKVEFRVKPQTEIVSAADCAPVSVQNLERNPILNLEGFILRDEIAERFESEQFRSDRMQVTCKLDVEISIEP